MMEKKAATKKSCFHCGEACDEASIIWDDKNFCCEGCKLIFQLLEEHQLCSYYSLSHHPGLSQKNIHSSNQFEFLDDEKIAGQLILLQEKNFHTVEFQVPSMHCSSCIWLLENLTKLHPGIVRSRVNFMLKEATIVYRPGEITLRQVAELMAHIGYPPALNLDTVGQKKRRGSERNILYQIGVAGFCFGNIMMLSLPEYLSGKAILDPGLKHFFSYLNLVLALPVFFYSAADYFKASWRNIRQGIFSIDLPIALGLIVMFVRSTYEIVSHTGPGYFDSMTGLVFLLLIGKYVQQNTYRFLSFERDYKSFFPLAVRTRLNGQEHSMPVSELKPGDKIIIRNEELIPADSYLLRGAAHIDYSFVTGEAEPVQKEAGDMIYAGGRQCGTTLELQVARKVSQSYLTQLWNDSAFQEKGSGNRVHDLATIISKWFTVIILAVAVITGIFWYMHDVSTGMRAFTSVLIIACPCALAITIPFALGHAMRYLGRNGFYVKGHDAIEKLAGINTIVFDKTGTITVSQEAEVNFVGDEIGRTESDMIAAVLSHSTHPLSRRIYKNIFSGKLFPLQNFRELPGQGVEADILCNRIKAGSASFVGVWHLPENLQTSRVYVSVNGFCPGYFSIKTKWREGLEPLITSLRKHYKISLLSGDHNRDEAELTRFFKKEEMHFNQTPAMKLAFIRSLQEKGERVAMVGDGLNDAGALSQADAGISVTDDVSRFTPASSAIMAGNQLPRLDAFFRYSRLSVRVILITFILSLVYNMIGLSFSVQGLLSPLLAAILMPLSSITVVAATTFMEWIYARRSQLT